MMADPIVRIKMEIKVNAIKAIVLAQFFFSTGELLAQGKSDPSSDKEAIFAGWDRLEKEDESLRAIDSTWTRKYLEGPQKKNTSGISRYRRNGESESVTSESKKTDVIVRNSRYDFYLSRETSSSQWVARFVNINSNGQRIDKIPEGVFLIRNIEPSSAMIVGASVSRQKKWSSLKADPDFQLTKIERLNNNNLLVCYKYNLIIGEFECDPGRNYIIVKGKSTESDGVSSYIVNFERKLGPAVKNSVESLVYEVISNPIDAIGKLRHEAVYSYPNVDKTNELDEERFRLSYYGLPEPEGVVWEKPRNYLPYWLVGGGALVVVLATLVLRYLRKRPREIQ